MVLTERGRNIEQPPVGPAAWWRWAAWSVVVVASAAIPLIVIQVGASERRNRNMRAVCGWLPVADQEVICTYASLACGVTVAVLWPGLWAISRWRGFSSLSDRAGRFAYTAFLLNVLLLFCEVSSALVLPDEQVDAGHFCSGHGVIVQHGLNLLGTTWQPIA